MIKIYFFVKFNKFHRSLGLFSSLLVKSGNTAAKPAFSPVLFLSIHAGFIVFISPYNVPFLFLTLLVNTLNSRTLRRIVFSMYRNLSPTTFFLNFRWNLFDSIYSSSLNSYIFPNLVGCLGSFSRTKDSSWRNDLINLCNFRGFFYIFLKTMATILVRKEGIEYSYCFMAAFSSFSSSLNLSNIIYFHNFHHYYILKIYQ